MAVTSICEYIFCLQIVEVCQFDNTRPIVKRTGKVVKIILFIYACTYMVCTFTLQYICEFVIVHEYFMETTYTVHIRIMNYSGVTISNETGARACVHTYVRIRSDICTYVRRCVY